MRRLTVYDGQDREDEQGRSGEVGSSVCRRRHPPEAAEAAPSDRYDVDSAGAAASSCKTMRTSQLQSIKPACLPACLLRARPSVRPAVCPAGQKLALCPKSFTYRVNTRSAVFPGRLISDFLTLLLSPPPTPPPTLPSFPSADDELGRFVTSGSSFEARGKRF